MKTISYLRLAVLAILISLGPLTANAQARKVSLASQDGFWVIETPPHGRQCIVRFYNDQNQLIYEETLNRCLKVNQLKTQRSLNVALEQALFVWKATHKMPMDRQWVAIQFDKKK